MLVIDRFQKDKNAELFCEEFIASNRPKFIFGRNEFAESIANCVSVDGVVDDFTDEKHYLGVPVVKIQDIPDTALVVGSVIGKPLAVKKRIDQFNFTYLDYFAFVKYSGLPVKEVMFWGGFESDFTANRVQYENIYDLLCDDISKEQFLKIINFRLSYDLKYMENFKAIEENQYFEDFLNLHIEGETFVDIGGFDGFTTREFVRRCPQYKEIYFFEPTEKNLSLAERKLKDIKRIKYFQCGLSNKKQSVSFSYNASSSKISDDGDLTIDVDLLDNIISKPVTFIKMDIEGAEGEAINGAKKTIKNNHPILAISVYHKPDDFWVIPKQILAIRNDYDIFLRHYTEGISETIMFFVPKGR